MPSGARFFASLWILLVLPAAAHAHVDPVTGQDYRDFTRNDGLGSCCDWHDCRPAHAPVTEPDGEMIVDFGNNKYRFDPSKVVKRPSDDGHWHVCGDARKLKCIIAPVESRRDGDGIGGLVGEISLSTGVPRILPLRLWERIASPRELKASAWTRWASLPLSSK